MAPSRSSRVLVKIPEVTVTRKRDGEKVDEPVIVKMKNSHRKLLKLEALDGDDPILQGTFSGEEGNGGYKFLRNLGGFRARSITLYPKDTFTLEEENADADSENPDAGSVFKSIDIGFPQGVKVVEIYNWLRGLDDEIRSKIAYMRTWSGRKVDFTTIDNAPAAPAPDAGEPPNSGGQPLLPG